MGDLTDEEKIILSKKIIRFCKEQGIYNGLKKITHSINKLVYILTPSHNYIPNYTSFLIEHVWNPYVTYYNGKIPKPLTISILASIKFIYFIEQLAEHEHPIFREIASTSLKTEFFYLQNNIKNLERSKKFSFKETYKETHSRLKEIYHKHFNTMNIELSDFL